MAEANSMKAADVVPFFATSDDYNRTELSEEKPVMIINPDASIQDIWLVVEARLNHLQKMLGIFVCTDSEVVFSPADYAEMFKPRVDELVILAEEANRRAKSTRVDLRAVTAG